jgi:hypothetical protein
MNFQLCHHHHQIGNCIHLPIGCITLSLIMYQGVFEFLFLTAVPSYIALFQNSYLLHKCPSILRTTLFNLLFYLQLLYWSLLYLFALPLWKLRFFVTNYVDFLCKFDSYTGYKLIWNMELMRRYVSHLPVIPLIEVSYLVNYAANSYAVYPIIIKYFILSSLVGRTSNSIDNKNLTA